MKMILSPLLTVALPILGQLNTAHAAPKPIGSIIRLATEREDAIYQVGESVAFKLEVLRGESPIKSGKISYILDDTGPNKIADGQIELNGEQQIIKGKLPRPGFLRCVVTYRSAEGKTIRSIAGAAVSPEKIEPSLPVPTDFEKFWNQQKSLLAKIPVESKLTPVQSRDGNVEAFDAQISCVDEVPVSGYLARPRGAKPKSLPIVLWVHGAGVGSSSLGNAVTGAKNGMLSMDINAHGLPNGKPRTFYTEQNAGPLKNYRHAGREKRETIYFRGMFLRLVRAIDFLTAQPEWDGKTVCVIGHSQGGYQALVAGGLDSRVTFIGVGVPAGCDHTGAVANRVSGWPKIVPNGSDGKPDAAILEASRYVDAVNFASACKAEAIMSVGFIDGTCPPTSCYAAYNQLKGPKSVINEPLMGHAAPSHIKDAFLAAALKHAGLKAEK